MSIRDNLLLLLKGDRGQIFSGEDLARQLGVSRTAVWKQIQSLKSVGVPLQSIGRDGYQMGVPGDPSLLQYQGSIAITPHYYLNTMSTQGLAKAGAESGLRQGHVWIAETQSKGRGRLERPWESAYGGLWFSLLLRPTLPPARVAPVTLVAGLALQGAVEKLSGVKARLKWPNDLLVPGPKGTFRKLAGILTEMSGQMERTEWMVLGVGINVHNAISPDLTSIASSLYALTGRPLSRSRLLSSFLDEFFRHYTLFLKKGFEPFRAPYWAQYYAPMKPVSLNTSSGVVIGKPVGVDAQGALMIESRRKIRHFSEGEIAL